MRGKWFKYLLIIVALAVVVYFVFKFIGCNGIKDYVVVLPRKLAEATPLPYVQPTPLPYANNTTVENTPIVTQLPTPVPDWLKGSYSTELPLITEVPSPTLLPVSDTPLPTWDIYAHYTYNTPDTVSRDGFLTEDEKIMLVNFEHRIDSDYMPHNLINAKAFFGDVCKVEDEQTLIQVEVATMAKEMFIDAANEGIDCKFIINNAFRTQEFQWYMWNKHVQEEPGYGMSPYTNPVGTLPGDASEHCAGLAIDICSTHYPYCNMGFGETLEGMWISKNAYRYGFVIRYPACKGYITGIFYEPWHLRYVGKSVAEQLYTRKICLEEYLSDRW